MSVDQASCDAEQLAVWPDQASKNVITARHIKLSTNCRLSSSKIYLGAPGLTTRNKKLLGAPGIATRSKDATRGSWPYYYSQVQLSETT